MVEGRVDAVALVPVVWLLSGRNFLRLAASAEVRGTPDERCDIVWW